MASTVDKRKDGTYAITIQDGPQFILLTGKSMASLLAAMRDAGIIPPLTSRRSVW